MINKSLSSLSQNVSLLWIDPYTLCIGLSARDPLTFLAAVDQSETPGHCEQTILLNTHDTIVAFVA